MMNQYLFSQNNEDSELKRLQLIEEAINPLSFALLDTIDFQDNWRVLDLGCGAGGISEAIYEQLSDNGSLVSLDRDTKYMMASLGDNHQVVEADFLDQDFTGEFDLIFCRYTLIHNTESQAMLEKMFSLLTNKGCVILQEPDFSSPRHLSRNYSDAFDRVNLSIEKMFRSRGMYADYGLHLAVNAQKAGFKVEDLDLTAHLVTGQTAISRLMADSARALAWHYKESGNSNDEDIAEYLELTENKEKWLCYYSTCSVIARK